MAYTPVSTKNTGDLVTAAEWNQFIRDNFAALAYQQAALEFVLNDGGAVLSTGIRLDFEVPFACTITGVSLLADQSGSMVVDVWKDSYANFPPTVADTICAAAKPTLAAAAKSQDTTLTGWTKTLSKGDILRINIDSCATITRALLSLSVTRVN